MSRLHIRQAGRTIAVGADESVLDAALKARIRYPFGCRAGNCGACKSRLLDGRIEHLPHSRFALSPEEEARGLFLACRARTRGDGRIAWLDLDEKIVHPRRDLTCRVESIDRPTDDIVILALKIEAGGPFSFAAGQYAQLRFADLPPRDFSFAGRPDEDGLRFHIRLRPDGTASGYLRERIRVGERVQVAGPDGQAFLRGQHDGPIVAAAGGTGLGPMLSIVETALARGWPHPVTLAVGARSPEAHYLLEHLHRLEERHDNLRLLLAVDEAAAGPFQHGRLPDILRPSGTAFAGAAVYCAGPPAMVEQVAALARADGVGDEDIHADPFTAAVDDETA